MTGKVWLIGAGPSDPGLFTLKGKRVLEEAEVVVYDRLVGQGVLSMIPEGAKLIDVGKRAGNHTMPQEQINEVLLSEARQGKKVVRLKGGDPFLFGRGGEELELLVKNEIPYEIVPGVTSALSVPAYNGIPVTHRDLCSSLHIITGHKRKGEAYDIDFEALVRTKGTLVFLMGVTALKDICDGLLKGGMNPKMPAAILQKGTTSRQKRVLATVDSLPQEVERQGIETPAIIVVGKVCSLAEQFSWCEKLPLFGKKIVVTRPKDLSSRMTEQLRKKGAEVLELPAIRTEACKDQSRLLEKLDSLETYQWLVFTSPTGVKVFFEVMRRERIDIRRLFHLKVAVIGEGTKKALEERGVYPDLMPSTYDGRTLGETLAGACKGGEKILIPRAALGTEELIEALHEKEGLIVDDVPTYDTIYESSKVIDEKAEFLEDQIDYAVFTSASTVRGFAGAVQGIDFSKVKAVCIGKQTKAAADQLGMKTYVSQKATIDSVIALTEELCQSKA
ncbi:MAG: uroporphyrinogen-III C-methyltransferase [Lachnospiraceae bacterium]|nr:uroporphyrinogen-III C-methyltransferase [Robinsoniella sp.]MDY3767295.1 uroporphyrinogen-III C-methyltransferase [Lachnospiraceae bacterium]